MTGQFNEVVVIKLDAEENEVWCYPGRVLSKTEHSMLVEARFTHSDVSIHGMTLRKNDRFLERYYDDRWYNIMEARDRDNNRLKGWYCNVTQPARFMDGQIAYVDLALDVLVYPDGHFLVLDEDEFQALNLDPTTRQQALTGLQALVTLAREGKIGAETQI